MSTRLRQGFGAARPLRWGHRSQSLTFNLARSGATRAGGKGEVIHFRRLIFSDR